MEAFAWHTENLNQNLRLREYLFTLFHVLLGSAPQEDQLTLATSRTSIETLQHSFAHQGMSSEKIAKRLIFELDTAKDHVDSIAQEYTRLFIGPGSLPVPPWESVFRSEDSVLFSQKTLEVRNAYRAAGFRPVLSPHIADDHIALEFGFIAALSHQACNAYEDDDREGFDTALNHTKNFMDQHMFRWIPSYTRKVTELGQFPFYSAVIAASSRFLEIDRNALEEISADKELIESKTK